VTPAIYGDDGDHVSGIFTNQAEEFLLR